MDLPEHMFFDWLKENFKRKWFAFTIGFLVIAIASPLVRLFISWGWEQLGHQPIEYLSINLVIHLIIILTAILIIVSHKRRQKPPVIEKYLKETFHKNNLSILKLTDNKIPSHISKAIQINANFVQYMLLLWCFLFALYALFAVKQWGFTIKEFPESKKIYSLIECFINNCTCVIFFLAYFNINYRNIEKSRANSITILISMAVLAFSLIHSIYLFKENLWANENPDLWFHLLSGLSVGISFTLLIGKLTSRIINAPVRVTGLLFFYSLLQPLFVLFTPNDSSSCFPNFDIAILGLLWFCLILKILFFGLIMWLIKKDRLMIYLLFKPQVESIIKNDGKELERAFDIIREETLKEYYKSGEDESNE